jgi:hypothetical protein
MTVMRLENESSFFEMGVAIENADIQSKGDETRVLFSR